MARKRKDWEDSWLLVTDETKQGGQGIVRKVMRRDGSDAALYALKELRRQDDPERRARMRREIVALETIPHPSTPKVFDHNTDKYLTEGVPLFAVLEFIDGVTLSEFLLKQSGALALDQALTLVERILDVLEVYHLENSGHRDIKPDNIILRSSLPATPVLIDFGLTFNTADNSDPLTWTGQQVGNRFLSLPEHAASSGNKRDLRSDLTFCVGILYYCLTTLEPSVLTDERGRLPHQREAAQAKLSLLPPPYRAQIFRIFDVGFSMALNDRWQTVSALRDQLLRVREVEEHAEDAAKAIAALQERALTKQSNQKVYDALTHVRERVRMAALNAAVRLGEGYRPNIEAREVNMGRADTWIRCGVEAYLEGKILNTPFMIRAVGDEIVAEELHVGGERTVRARVPVSAPSAVDDLHDIIVETIIGNVSRGIET